MLTINTLLKEIKEIPVSRLEEVYQFIHSLTPKSKKTDKLRKKILSFGGILSEMTSEEYKDFLSKTAKSRKESFNRKVDL